MQNQNEIYPHAPLLETVFEIRFPGELSVECRRDVFFMKVSVRDSLYSKSLGLFQASHVLLSPTNSNLMIALIN